MTDTDDLHAMRTARAAAALHSSACRAHIEYADRMADVSMKALLAARARSSWAACSSLAYRGERIELIIPGI